MVKEDIIDSKKKIDCPRNADGHKLSPYEIYHLSKIECNQFYLKKLGLGDSMLKNATVCKKRKSKVCS